MFDCKQSIFVFSTKTSNGDLYACLILEQRLQSIPCTSERTLAIESSQNRNFVVVPCQSIFSRVELNNSAICKYKVAIVI